MATPKTIIPITTGTQGQPAASRIAQTALTSATWLPTERSMPAVTITRVMATATTRIGAACRSTLSPLLRVRKCSAPDREDDDAEAEEGGDREDLRVLGHAVGEGATLAALGVAQCSFSPTMRWTRSSRLVSPHGPLGDLGALVHHGDAVADAEEVLEPVGDEHDRDAARLHAGDQREHRLDLRHGERAGRLVHDQDARLEGGGAGDGDRLALPARQLRHLGREAGGCGSAGR